MLRNTLDQMNAGDTVIIFLRNMQNPYVERRMVIARLGTMKYYAQFRALFRKEERGG